MSINLTLYVAVYLLRVKIFGLLLIACFFSSFDVIPSFGLTESVNLFGEINSVDLILNDVWIEPENPKDGESVSIHGSVYNAGIIQTGDVSDAVTVAYIVNGEIVKVELLEHILPGIENGIHISSGPSFDAFSGNYIVTVIINYHDTLSHLRDNVENNIVQKIFKIGDVRPSLITSEIYQQYDDKTGKQQVTIHGELSNLFQEKLSNREIIVDIGTVLHKKIITDVNGEFSLMANIPFVNENIKVTIDLEDNSTLSTSSQNVYPIKLNEGESAIAFEIIPNSNMYDFENPPYTIALFQDSYENMFKIISTNEYDVHSMMSDNIFLTVVPANHEYIAELYYEGRFLDSFQTFFKDSTIVKKDIFIPEYGQVKFRVLDDLNEPQINVTVDNWIYSSVTSDDGMTEWIEMLPTVIPSEPYVAKATLSDGSVIWSEEFLLESEEKKVISIIKGDLSP